MIPRATMRAEVDRLLVVKINPKQRHEDTGSLPKNLRSAKLSCLSVKERVLPALHRPPDDVDYRDVAEEIAFLAALQEVERDIDEGRLATNEQMKTRIAERATS